MNRAYKFYLICFLFIALSLTSCGQQSVAQNSSAKTELPKQAVSVPAADISQMNTEETAIDTYKEVESFILKNYSCIFYDYSLQMVKSIAFRKELPVDLANGMEEAYTAFDFSLYDFNQDSIFEIVITFIVPETEATYFKIFQLINGEYKEVCKSNSTYILCKDDENEPVLIEKDFIENNTVVISNLEVSNDSFSKKPVLNVSNFVDASSRKKYTEIELETMIDSFVRLEEIPSQTIKEQMNGKINLATDESVGWKDMYPCFLLDNDTDNAEFILYDVDNDAVPELIFNKPIPEYMSRIFSYKNGRVYNFNYDFAEDIYEDLYVSEQWNESNPFNAINTMYTYTN